MSTAGKIIKNSFSIIGGNFLNKVISILLLLYLTGYLDPAEFGRFSFVTAYVTFFGIFTDLGLNTLVTRDISGEAVDPRRTFGHAIMIRLGATIITAVALLSSLLVMGYPVEVVRLSAAASIALFLSFRGLFLRTVFHIPFQVHLRMHVPALLNFLNELITLGAVIWLIAAGADLTTLVLGMGLANLPGFILTAYFSTRLIRPVFRVDLAQWGRILKGSLPLGAAVLLEGVFLIIPVFLLSVFSTEESVGYFSLPFRLSASLWIIPVAVMLSFLPKMSRDAAISPQSINSGFSRGLKVALLAALPLALATTFSAGTLIDIFTGGRYEEAAPVLKVLIWGTAAYFVNTVFFYTFTAANLQKVNTMVWSVIAVLSLALSLLLIPTLNHLGASVAFSASLAAGAVVNLWYGSRLLNLAALPVLLKFAACALLAGGVLVSVPFNTLATSFLAVTVYASSLIFTGAVSFKEWGEWLNEKEVAKKGL